VPRVAVVSWLEDRGFFAASKWISETLRVMRIERRGEGKRLRQRSGSQNQRAEKLAESNPDLFGRLSQNCALRSRGLHFAAAAPAFADTMRNNQREIA
jgi:hypothetical protein